MIETAVILAAGRGSKIWPYGDTWPKAALPIANRPLIQWQIQALQACGVKKVVVVIGHLGGQIRDAVGGLPGVKGGEQNTPQGTADSLLCGLACIKDERFAVCCGDVLLTEEDLKRLFDAANETGVETALAQPLGKLSSGEGLCANLKDNAVEEILGQPREASHRLCGVYVLSRKIVPYLVNNPGVMRSVEVGNMPPNEAELAESLSVYLRGGGEIQAVENQNLFYDLDKPWHLLDANQAYLNYLGSELTENRIHSTACIDPGAEIDGYLVADEGSVIGKRVKIKGNLWLGANAQVIDGAIVGENCSIGEGASVREYCRIEAGSSIGARCVVGHCAEFGGILMDGAYSYHYGEYWGIIGRSSDLGAATVCGNLRFDDQRTIHRIGGRREVPDSGGANAAYLGDYTRTGVNAILMPGVKIGPYSVIGAGVILNEDLPNNSLIYVKQELTRTNWGPEKYGW
jgi:UDP-N-acetylglucosamine diphosphorylase / glucose-1-phosphate thymidylyltransferase / UDP-N-acetylgalactosamine diphosphorylase / glucosamine-1-phosphate N-acetyltransferase / galactosamine-1-phosphate N-acetyltransferase